MTQLRFYAPGRYENPLTASGRGRTIAAFRLAQGDVDVLTNADMRRDILKVLMSESAVSYWLNIKGWLEKTRKVGRIQLVRLTDSGLITCANSLAGGSEVPTALDIVLSKRQQMLHGGPGTTKRLFDPL